MLTIFFVFPNGVFLHVIYCLFLYYNYRSNSPVVMSNFLKPCWKWVLTEYILAPTGFLGGLVQVSRYIVALSIPLTAPNALFTCSKPAISATGEPYHHYLVISRAGEG